MKKLPLILITVALLAGGGWWYYTTTPDYLIAGIKKACAQNSFTEMAKGGIAHINGETRELTEDERSKLTQVFDQRPEEDCPFKDKALVKEKLAQADLDKYQVKAGFALAYEGNEESALKILKFNNKWRYLMIEVDFTGGPASAESPQVEFTSPEIQPGLEAAPPIDSSGDYYSL